MTDTDYEIHIVCGDEMLKISPDSPLKLLAGGLNGFDSTDFDVETGAYADDNGGYIKRRRFAEREISVKFDITENDRMWRRQIVSLVNPRKDCTIHVEMGGGVKRCISAVPVGRVTFEQESFYDITVTTLRFIAPDPFLMAEDAQVIEFSEKVPLLTFPMNFYPKSSLTAGYTIHTDSASAVNEGDAACGIVVTISARGGEVFNPCVTCGDKFVRAAVTLFDGDELVIDTRKRKKGIWLNGENRLIFDRKSTFFSLDVGKNEVKIDADSGKEYMAVRCEYVPLYFGL